MFFIHVVFLIYYYFHARKVEYGSDLDNFKFKKKLRYFHSGKPEECYACIYINGKSLTTSHIHITIYASSKIDNMYYLGRVGVGFGNTVRAVADDFMDKIEMEAQVTSIDYTDPENVKVSYTKNRIRHNIIAKSVLVTVSLGVLKANAIKFTPRLPKDKQDAIAGSSMGTVNKAILIWDDTNVEIPNEQWFSLITPESNTSGQWTTFLNPTQYKGGVTTIVAWIG